MDPTALQIQDDPKPPRQLAFYDDHFDAAGNMVGWLPTAWGLLLADGQVMSVPVDGRRSVTWWRTLGEATLVLGYVDEVRPLFGGLDRA